MSYADFLSSKRRVWTGVAIDAPKIHPLLFEWQAIVTQWACRKGRAAIFADCGLGKTLMQLSWATSIPGRVVIVAPLCVGEQTIREGAKIGVEVVYVRDQDEAAATTSRIVITNYERIDRIDPSAFAGVVLDESSILKSFDGKTRRRLIEMFVGTKYRLCCTATPAPNEIAEMANHAEFLGLMTRAEFLATWFVHDEDGWRMKRPAVEPFYRWLASWGMMLRAPSDIGFPDDGFTLPPLHQHEHIVRVEFADALPGLFPDVSGLNGRIRARRGSIGERAAMVSDLAEDGHQWLVWCGLNDEADVLEKLIPGSENVQGSDSYERKVSIVESFIRGDVRVLVTKPKILGFGMNFQHCSRMAHCGITDSYESYYQSTRRVWRFGQKQPVENHVVISEAERKVLANVMRKEHAARSAFARAIDVMRELERTELCAVKEPIGHSSTETLARN
jgi:hypothetical protein